MEKGKRVPCGIPCEKSDVVAGVSGFRTTTSLIA